MTRIAAIAAVLIAVAGMAAMLLIGSGGKGGDQFAECGAGAVAGDLGGPFTLVTGDGETVTSEQVITGPTLIYFGYTYCPDVCPTTLTEMTGFIEALGQILGGSLAEAPHEPDTEGD